MELDPNFYADFQMHGNPIEFCPKFGFNTPCKFAAEFFRKFHSKFARNIFNWEVLATTIFHTDDNILQ